MFFQTSLVNSVACQHPKAGERQDWLKRRREGKENTFCITKASTREVFTRRDKKGAKTGRSWVKGFPLMNSRFEKAARILPRLAGEGWCLVTKGPGW